MTIAKIVLYFMPTAMLGRVITSNDVSESGAIAESAVRPDSEEEQPGAVGGKAEMSVASTGMSARYSGEV